MSRTNAKTVAAASVAAITKVGKGVIAIPPMANTRGDQNIGNR